MDQQVSERVRKADAAEALAAILAAPPGEVLADDAKCERDCTRCGNAGPMLDMGSDADPSAPPHLDLTAVMGRVAREHFDWDQARLLKAEFNYRRFLHLSKLSDETAAPAKDVDTVWHAHILYTEDYVRFCETYFGHYLHHRPER